jgi:oligopeptide transport system permease protein
MRHLLRRFLRDLLLVPLTAFLVYELAVHLPYKRDDDRKTAALVSVEAQMQHDLGVGQPLGFLRPWQKLAAGERLGDDAFSYTAADLARALGGSLRLGLVALLLALAWGTAYAAARLTLRGRGPAALLETLPAIAFGTPAFLLALMVAMLTARPGFDVAWNDLLASLVMSAGPGVFVGVVLHDALKAEVARPYFTTALAKGLSRGAALFRHALPNALPTLLDAVGPVATSLIAGSFVAERLFNVTYFGFLYLYAAKNMEVALVVVATTIFASLLILVSTAVEAARLLVDPKARSHALGEAS